MKSYLKTNFCEFIFREDEKYKEELFQSIKKSERKNYEIFKFEPEKFVIELVYSYEEYDKKTGLKNVETYKGGYLIGNKFIIVSPMIKELEFDFDSYFMHEINHIFYISLVGSYKPVWLSEGMACYFQKSFLPDIKAWKRYFNSIDKPEKYLYYRFIKEKYYNNTHEFYILSYIVFIYLEKHFGTNKIIEFLKCFSKDPFKKNFDLLLKNHFGLNSKNLVKKSLK